MIVNFFVAKEGMRVAEKKVYILLTDTGTIFTKLIKLYTKKPYNHASISFDSELRDVYSFGRKTTGNPFIGGFVKENMKEDFFKQAKCAIYSFAVTEDQMEKMNHYIKEMEEKKDDYRYNFLGLFGFILNRPIKRKKAFFCSQFVSTILKECNIIHFEKPPSLITPYDLQKTSEFQSVYEGQLAAYYNKSNSEEVHLPIDFIPAEM
jgi:hypothetical protein